MQLSLLQEERKDQHTVPLGQRIIIILYQLETELLVQDSVLFVNNQCIQLVTVQKE